MTVLSVAGHVCALCALKENLKVVHRITESSNHLGHKRPSRSLNWAINLIPSTMCVHAFLSGTHAQPQWWKDIGTGTSSIFISCLLQMWLSLAITTITQWLKAIACSALPCPLTEHLNGNLNFIFIFGNLNENSWK